MSGWSMLTTAREDDVAGGIVIGDLIRDTPPAPCSFNWLKASSRLGSKLSRQEALGGGAVNQIVPHLAALTVASWQAFLHPFAHHEPQHLQHDALSSERRRISQTLKERSVGVSVSSLAT
jgi:hypothetical protein